MISNVAEPIWVKLKGYIKEIAQSGLAKEFIYKKCKIKTFIIWDNPVCTLEQGQEKDRQNVTLHNMIIVTCWSFVTLKDSVKFAHFWYLAPCTNIHLIVRQYNPGQCTELE